MNDNDLLEAVRDGFSHVGLRTSAAEVTGRGRALRRQRRLLPGLASVAAISTAVGVGLASVGAAAPAAHVRHPASRHPAPAARSAARPTVPRSTYTATFAVRVERNGLVGLTDFPWKPAGYQRALARAGIPAVVVTGRLSACRPPAKLFRRIVRLAPTPKLRGHGPFPRAKLGRWDGYAYVVNLSAIPGGARLGIFYGRKFNTKPVKGWVVGVYGLNWATFQPISMVLLNSRGGCLAGPDHRPDPYGPLGIGEIHFRPLHHQH